MCYEMRLERRLIFLGIILVVFSMTMAPQYATTRVTYSFGIVHPSHSYIRYIGSDNSSGDNMRVLRVSNNNTPVVTIELGDWLPDSEKNYTAAFGIVNEEQFPVNITYVNVSGTEASYLTIWLHHDRTADYTGEVADEQVKVVEDGSALYSASSCTWQLGTGDNDTTTSDAGTILWDSLAHVQYTLDDNDATNQTDDFVWVGFSLDLPSNATKSSSSGTIYIHFEATTII